MKVDNQVTENKVIEKKQKKKLKWWAILLIVVAIIAALLPIINHVCYMYYVASTKTYPIYIEHPPILTRILINHDISDHYIGYTEKLISGGFSTINYYDETYKQYKSVTMDEFSAIRTSINRYNEHAALFGLHLYAPDDNLITEANGKPHGFGNWDVDF